MIACNALGERPREIRGRRGGEIADGSLDMRRKKVRE